MEHGHTGGGATLSRFIRHERALREQRLAGFLAARADMERASARRQDFVRPFAILFEEARLKWLASLLWK